MVKISNIRLFFIIWTLRNKLILGNILRREMENWIRVNICKSKIIPLLLFLACDPLHCLAFGPPYLLVCCPPYLLVFCPPYCLVCGPPHCLVWHLLRSGLWCGVGGGGGFTRTGGYRRMYAGNSKIVVN